MKGDLLWAAKRIEELEEALGYTLGLLELFSISDDDTAKCYEYNKLLEDK